MAAVIITFLLIGTASAYSVPEEYKNTAMTDDELYHLADSHKSEPWANYIVSDMGYRYGGRNTVRILERLQYQANIPKITRNNLVVINN